MDRLRRLFSPEDETAAEQDAAYERALAGLTIVDVAPGGTVTKVDDPSTSAAAEVIPAADAVPMVTMYRDAIPVEVPLTEQAKFETLGFLLHEPQDLVALAREVGAYANELYPLMMKLTDAVMEDGVIDPAEESHYHALTTAFNLVGKKLRIFHNVLFQNYPVQEE